LNLILHLQWTMKGIIVKDTWRSMPRIRKYGNFLKAYIAGILYLIISNRSWGCVRMKRIGLIVLKLDMLIFFQLLIQRRLRIQIKKQIIIVNRSNKDGISDFKLNVVIELMISLLHQKMNAYFGCLHFNGL